MGSIKHPKLLSVDQMEGISEAFHEIWDTITVKTCSFRF